MKKRISLVLALVCVLGVLSLSACGDKENGGDKGGAQQSVQLGEGENALSFDETTIKEMLSAYPQSALGMKKEIYDYDLTLTADKFKDNDAVKIEAYLEKAEKPEKTFMFSGSTFYVYDEAKEKYLKLTVTGPVEETKPQTTKKVLTDEDVAEENNSVLHNRYKKYDLSALKLPKDISEYDFKVTGIPAVAADKKQVFVIHLVEKNGEDTGIRFAVGDSGDYYFNAEKNAYVKLK